MSPPPIDILSSSSYPVPEQLMRGRGHTQTEKSDVLYGGLTLIPDEAVTTTTATTESSSSNDSTKSKKKQKSANTNKNGSDDDSSSSKAQKRKRGRPRVLNKDENAAERRRTQIRLAQRAYRSRKEATISLLNDRLTELDLAIQEMSKSFGSFYDGVTSSGLLSQQKAHLVRLQRLKEKSDALLRLSGPSQVSSDADEGEDLGAEMPGSFYTADKTTSDHPALDVVGDGGLLIDQSPIINSEEFDALYSASTDDTSFGASLFQKSYAVDDNIQQQQQAVTEGTGMQLIPSFPEPLLSRSSLQDFQHHQLPLPSTYSFRETTFALRLRRHCLEHCYRLLTDSRSDPSEMSRVFRFPLSYQSRPALVDRFARLLNNTGTIDNNSNNINNIGVRQNSHEMMMMPAVSPRYTVGNAGIHFSRDSPARVSPLTSSPSSSSSSLMPDIHPISKFIGPWPFHLGEIPHNATSIGELLSARGMGGEWFDSNDVESYLKGMGIYVDAQSSFVTVPSSILAEIDPQEVEYENREDIPQVHELPVSSLSSAATVPTTAAASDSLPFSSLSLPSAAPLQIDPSLFDSSMDSPAQNQNDMDLSTLAPSLIMESEAMNIDDNIDNSFDIPTTQFFPQEKAFSFTANSNSKFSRQEVPRILDVESFLSQLINKAVCLGQRAGYRKQDVEYCLRVACYSVA